MSEALFGLLGTAVGALAAFGGSWVAAKYEFKQQRLALEKEAEKQQEAVQNEWREVKLERFAPFLAAYHAEEARIVEVIENLREQWPGWDTRIVETVEDDQRRENLATLNRSLGWISLLSEQEEAQSLASRASRLFDQLMTQLTDLATDAKGGDRWNLRSWSPP